MLEIKKQKKVNRNYLIGCVFVNERDAPGACWKMARKNRKREAHPHVQVQL